MCCICMCCFANFEVQLYSMKVSNKPNKRSSHIPYKMLQSFAKTRYPSLLFRPIRLEICWVWACARDLESKSLCFRAMPLNGIERKRLADSQKCTETACRRSHATSVTLISLFSPRFLSVDRR